MARSVAIAGSGMAGTSLALALIERGFTGRITLVDARSAADAARTWCWWDVGDLPFGTQASAQWTSWRIADGRAAVVRGSDRHPYVCLRGADFYAAAQQTLNRPQIKLVCGERVGSLSETPAAGILHCASGRDIEADIVIDARGARTSRGAALQQRFLGRFVRLADPVLAPQTVTLMDFRVARRGVAHFMYLLPFAADRALVEDTVLSVEPTHEAEHRIAIDDYAARVLGTQIVTVEAEERGVLPLDPAPPPRPGRRVGFAGAAAGAVRASSGYAFARTQRHASRLAQAIVDGAPLPALRAERYRMLDAALLALLRARVVQAPWFFRTLFAKAPPDALARFLCDASSPADDAGMLASLLPFAA